MYEPQPLDTSGVLLTDDLKQAVETLADSVHDEWAKRRIAEGWTLGDERNDQAKTHPCLVPYSDLPDSEKNIDRGTVELTIRSLIKLGYPVDKPDGTPHSESRPNDSQSTLGETDRQDMASVLDSNSSIADMMKAWNRLASRNDALPVEVYRSVAKRLLSNGTPVAAIDVLRRGLDIHADDLLLQQLNGLALSRIGESQKANRAFKDLVGTREWQPSESLSANTIEEVLGGFARTYKDLGLSASTPADRTRYLHRALEEYARAHEVSAGYWVGINVASVALLVGETDYARSVADEVSQQCTEMVDTGKTDYWLLATLGEAALVRGDLQAAERWYRAATDQAGHRFGDLNSTRRQARLLLQTLGEADSLIDEWLPIPKVVLFAGLPLDERRRSKERFPPRLENAVRETLRDWLITNNARIGFSSASCGSPILFQEVLDEIGGECHVVLPYEEQFVKERVRERCDESWVIRHEAVMQRASKVTFASMERIQPDHVTFDYATLVTHGLATIRTHELQTDLVGLTVWDGQPGRTEAATSMVVRRWQHLGVPVSRVDLSTLPESSAEPIAVIPQPPPDGGTNVRSAKGIEVMAMLFGDAVNFSKLSEDEVPRFVQHFLGAVRDVLNRYQDTNVVRNTWGDGLYLVFNHVREAGLFALDLQKRVAETDWYELSLPKDLSVRLALHAGPVFHCIDPVTGHENYTGRHVSRAARLEPKTPPGYVFASEAFAALAAADTVTEFNCDYVRQLEWAKTYGTFPTYLVRRAGKPSG